MIERTQDYRRVKKLMDENPIDDETEYELIVAREIFYLIEVQEGRDIGVWWFVPESNGEYYMHAAMSKACRGKAAVGSGLSAIRWLYNNTKANNIIAPVPENLKYAQRIPISAGLVYQGIEYGRKLYTMNRDLFKKQNEVT